MNDSPQQQFDLLESTADGKEIPRVRMSARARRMSIRVYPDARVEVVVPPRARAREVERFVAAHRQWINEKRAVVLRNRPAPQAFPPESIELRVIEYQIPGFRPSAIVTNMKSPKRISREDWVRMATESESGRSLDRRIRLRVGLYHRRWEIETTFHELKADQGLERSLRSRTAASIRYEVAGHVVLYLLIRWLMVEAAARAAPDGDPLGLSFKHALEELLTAWPMLLTADASDVSRRILPRLLKAIASHQVNWRPGRSFPRKPKSKTKRSKKRKSKQKTVISKHEAKT